MFLELIKSMLGPSGVKVLAFYDQHSLIINGAVVLIGLAFLFAPRFMRRYADKLQAWYDRSPFAPSEKDKRAIDAAQKKYGVGKYRRK